MENLKNILAQNLVKLRKASNMTQSELAEKLSYSDKAVSKWERGESLPDIEILYEISKLYNVTIDELLSEEVKINHTKKLKTKMRFIISLISSLLVWLIATIVFVFLVWLNPDKERQWLVFIYAIPVSSIVVLVFNSIWGNKMLNCLIVSVLMWTIILSIFLTVPKFDNSYLIFFIAIPVQIIILCWFGLLVLKEKEIKLNELLKIKKKKNENND
ncbi:MAG: helix-turn-helix domain-containing protein [Coprobacillus sp.]|mgnify:FL=1|nr:helix-turn-helix domain-containing protein [Coprobacillus sp.]MDY4145085.1 helix-turn-helix transcriptional regulator [Bacilli bacterium]CCY07351.1 helix-turn-helix domain protein [Coprobacillus sp. CAG:698]